MNFIRKETNDNSINLYYQLNELEKIKLYFNNKILLEKIFPWSISLKRLRDLLSIQLNKNFNFLFNNQIIQSQEESFFCLKNIIKDDILYLNDDEFNFIDMEEQNPNENIIINKNKITDIFLIQTKKKIIVKNQKTILNLSLKLKLSINCIIIIHCLLKKIFLLNYL